MSSERFQLWFRSLVVVGVVLLTTIIWFGPSLSADSLIGVASEASSNEARSA